MIEPNEQVDDDVVARVLANAESRSSGYAVFGGSAQALQAEEFQPGPEAGHDGDQQDR